MYYVEGSAQSTCATRPAFGRTPRTYLVHYQGNLPGKLGAGWTVDTAKVQPQRRIQYASATIRRAPSDNGWASVLLRLFRKPSGLVGCSLSLTFRRVLDGRLAGRSPDLGASRVSASSFFEVITLSSTVYGLTLLRGTTTPYSELESEEASLQGVGVYYVVPMFVS
ncbi:hypothetical protein ASPZODRAFT_145282 [Penicilliopsis zonata CBS 506.65]|uniref:Uncharacterized protein n=1 Tax=Penicilliopsis zonata CBS 506.65 TaxID=1073090 RepID=A0A1L9SAN7_9EURO|nr:hypothetical protein ASPZODRAFT_145282 [Penicilliopsis zonata CBS 506.65]OJJ44169.1 hypothetical protein ASPZODRAFT_145282 [Penicilliopsis zonata CBS 506.65]